MNRLTHSFEFEITPVRPFNFNLTVENPAGWHLFTPFEIHRENVLWTATHFSNSLTGVKLSSRGSVDDPMVVANIFSRDNLEQTQQKKITKQIGKALGADQDLSKFYKIARNDSILKYAVEDLYGMHDTFPDSIFPDAVLAILLQMAKLKRSNEMRSSFMLNYGELAEFDQKKIVAWPLPERIAGVSENDLAKRCKVGYRAKNIVKLAKRLANGDFPTTEQLTNMEPKEAKKVLLELPGIGDYSADIINPHGGFPIDVWSAEVFGKLLFDQKPENNREAVEKVKKEGMKRWGMWSWMAFFYIAQDLPNLSKKLEKNLRLS
ncbi:MAG: DNA-3-methyladenine glycosylase family protein [Thermoplasmata archaeon]